MGNWESVEQSGDKNVNAWDKKSWVLLDGKATKDVAPSAPPLKDKTRTLIIVILDESGSMHTQKDDTIGSYNQLLADQREQCKEDEARLTLLKFNEKVTKVHEAKGLDDVPNLTGKTYKPSGGTALLDAVAVGICQGEIELRKAKGQEERVVVIIMTDGEENKSKTVTTPQIRARIAEKEALGNWTFTYMGENPDNWAQAMGQSASNSVGYNNTNSTRNMETVSAALIKFRSNKSSQSTTGFYKV